MQLFSLSLLVLYTSLPYRQILFTHKDCFIMKKTFLLLSLMTAFAISAVAQSNNVPKPLNPEISEWIDYNPIEFPDGQWVIQSQLGITWGPTSTTMVRLKSTMSPCSSISSSARSPFDIPHSASILTAELSRQAVFLGIAISCRVGSWNSDIV